jgi:flagellar hook assembly protein FlgD
VELFISDIRGRYVRTLLDAEVGSGIHRVVWDGRDDDGRHVASGVYLSSLRSGNEISSKKMVLRK